MNFSTSSTTSIFRARIATTGNRDERLSTSLPCCISMAARLGSLETEASQSAVTVTPGSVVLLFPDVWHRYRPVLNADDSFSSTLACTFGGEIAAPLAAARLISPRQPVSYVGNNPAVDNSFRRLHNQVQSGGELSLQQSLAGGLHELFGTRWPLLTYRASRSFPRV